MRKGLEIFGIILTMFGSVALLASLLFGIFTFTFVAGATHATGAVTAFANQNGLNYPVVTFPAQDSSINITMAYSNTSELYYIGDKVPVIYSADNPPGGKVDTFLGIWYLPTFLLIAAGVLLIVGLALALVPNWLARRKQPKYSLCSNPGWPSILFHLNVLPHNDGMVRYLVRFWRYNIYGCSALFGRVN